MCATIFIERHRAPSAVLAALAALILIIGRRGSSIYSTRRRRCLRLHHGSSFAVITKAASAAGKGGSGYLIRAPNFASGRIRRSLTHCISAGESFSFLTAEGPMAEMGMGTPSPLVRQRGVAL